MIAEGSLFWTQELLHFCFAPGHFAPLAAQGGALGKSREIYVRNAQIFGNFFDGGKWDFPGQTWWFDYQKQGLNTPNMMI